MSNTKRTGSTGTCPVCGYDSHSCGLTLGGYDLHHCKRCDLRFAPNAFGVNVVYDDAYEHGLYTEQAPEQMERHEEAGIDAAQLDTYAPFFKRYGPAGNRNRLLDVGCGGGRFVRAATRRGWDAIGIDVSKRAIENANALGRGQYQIMSVFEVPKTLGRFDVVTAFEVLEHTINPTTVLDAVRNLLKEDGLLFCTVPAWENTLVRRARRPDWVPPIHMLYFNLAALQAALRLSGYRIVEVGYIPHDYWKAPQSPMLRLMWEIRRIIGYVGYPFGIWASATPAKNEGFQPWGLESIDSA